MRIAISTESTCDLTKELLEQYNIKTVPFHITLKDKTIKKLIIVPNRLINIIV